MVSHYIQNKRNVLRYASPVSLLNAQHSALIAGVEIHLIDLYFFEGATLARQSHSISSYILGARRSTQDCG